MDATMIWWRRIGSKFALVAEFYRFMRVRRKWWLAPVAILLLLLGLLILFAQSSALAPLIYTLF